MLPVYYRSRVDYIFNLRCSISLTSSKLPCVPIPEQVKNDLE